MPRILLVEDDTGVRLVFSEIPFDAGYAVDAVRSFAAGAAILDGEVPLGLLITDGRFADGSGPGLADKARHRGVPALIITGDDFDIDGTRYRVLTKPLRPAARLAAVKAALSG